MKTCTKWRCPACGCLAGQTKANGDPGEARRAFTAGALGIQPQVGTQTFTGGRGHGMTWQWRPCSHEELGRIGLALARGLETVQDALGEEIVAAPPEAVLGALDDDEAGEVGQQWIDDAAAELERRMAIVAADRERRVFGS